MKKYNIDYIDNGGDLCHVWVMASSKDDARVQVKQEYWDIDRIVQIRES